MGYIGNIIEKQKPFLLVCYAEWKGCCFLTFWRNVPPSSPVFDVVVS